MTENALCVDGVLHKIGAELTWTYDPRLVAALDGDRRSRVPDRPAVHAHLRTQGQDAGFGDRHRGPPVLRDVVQRRRPRRRQDAQDQRSARIRGGPACVGDRAACCPASADPVHHGQMSPLTRRMLDGDLPAPLYAVVGLADQVTSTPATPSRSRTCPGSLVAEAQRQYGAAGRGGQSWSVEIAAERAVRERCPVRGPGGRCRGATARSTNAARNGALPHRCRAPNPPEPSCAPPRTSWPRSISPVLAEPGAAITRTGRSQVAASGHDLFRRHEPTAVLRGVGVSW